MIHPNTELRHISDEMGYGVFAKKFIPKGTFLWVLDELDKVISPEIVKNLPSLLRSNVEKYAYVDCQGDYVLCWDFGRYINHSCHPTMRSLGQSVEVAVRDVMAGEEITCEYGVLNLNSSFQHTYDNANCKQTDSLNNVATYRQDWDAEVNATLAVIPDVPQSLLPFVKTNSVDTELLGAIFNRQEVCVPSHVLYKSKIAGLVLP